MGIVFVYAVLGGMKGITYTQVAQYCVLIFAYTVPAVFIAIQITGNPIPQLAFGSEIAGTGTALLDKLDEIVTSLGFNQYTSGTKSRIDVFCITLALMVGTAGLPHVIVRFFTVRKVRDARVSAGYALLFIAFLYTTAPAVGSMARYNLVNTIQPGQVGSVDGNLAYDDRPDWFRTWQKTGLLTFDDKNGDGRIQYYDDSNPGFASSAAAVVSAGYALLFIAFLYTTAPAVGSMARYNLVNTIQPGQVGSVDGNLAYDDRPDWFRTWQKTGLLTFDDKNGDGRIQYYDDSNPGFASSAAAYGWNGNELEVDRDIMVLANPEIAGLPNWVIALVAAGGIAAALSTAAGLLLVISAAVSHDLIKGIFVPQISEKHELLAGRIAVAIAIGIAGYLGFDPPGWVVEVVAFAFGLAAASLFPVILLGIFFKRVNKQGAIAGMVTGLLFTYGYIEFFKGLFLKWAGAPWGENTAEHWLFGISPEGIGVIGMTLNFAVAISVSYMTAPPPEHIQRMVEHIRVPRHFDEDHA